MRRWNIAKFRLCGLGGRATCGVPARPQPGITEEIRYADRAAEPEACGNA